MECEWSSLNFYPHNVQLMCICIVEKLYESSSSVFHTSKVVCAPLHFSLNSYLFSFIRLVFHSFAAFAWSRAHVVPEITWAEVLLLDLDAALIAALMGIGPVTAKLETGRTSVIGVERGVILKKTARTVPRS